ncbi:MAG: HAMP domain-containing histidine kinase [Thermoleophilaceae bacterium]|nr:HAMP domain-containing histidine kinase [Thermoleophilaceae bacterium]
MTALALAGWLVAALAVARCAALAGRLELVALAAHELRTPLTVVSLEAERLRTLCAGCPHEHGRGSRVETQLERAKLGLADLEAARAGRRARRAGGAARVGSLVRRAAPGWERAARAAGGSLALDWRAGDAPSEAERGRVLQALDNLVANAIEHGGGQLVVSGRRGPGTLRVEVRDRGPGFGAGGRPNRRAGRGRGLAIARRAVEEAGGRLELVHGAEGATVAIELPLSDRRRRS